MLSRMMFSVVLSYFGLFSRSMVLKGKTFFSFSKINLILVELRGAKTVLFYCLEIKLAVEENRLFLFWIATLVFA